MQYQFKRVLALFLSLSFLLIATLPAAAEKTNVAVAANFTAAAKELAASFRAKTGHKAVLIFGSTGKLYTQIIHGAPFDIFLAADEKRPERLEKEGLVVEGKRFTYAIGQISLWSRDPEYFDPLGTVADQAAIIASERVTRLAIANPKTAPYGRAAREFLTGAGLYEKIKGKIVLGENISQTYQFAFTGNAELAIVARAQIVLSNRGVSWPVPVESYSPLEQQAVLLVKGAQNEAAVAFIDFLKSKEAAVIIKKFGYTVALK